MNLLAPFPPAFRYLSDMRPENCLFAAVLRSPHPHAKIISIDVARARAMPGVAAVITAADVPGRLRFGLRILDQPILCVDKVRTVGDPVAAVAASTKAQAIAACAAIEVIYELLPVVADPEQALAPGAPPFTRVATMFTRPLSSAGIWLPPFGRALISWTMFIIPHIRFPRSSRLKAHWLFRR